MKRRKGYYSISVVAKMFSVHQQTVRMYEKEGLISPKRTDGNTRLFSEEDVDKLEQVIDLTHKMGVNLAGVQMILKLQKKIKKLQGDMNKLFEQLNVNLDKEGEEYKKLLKGQGNRLLEMKKEGLNKNGEEKARNIVGGGENSNCDDESCTEEDDDKDWEVDYDDI